MGRIKITGKQIRACLVLISLSIFLYMYLVVYKNDKKDTEQLAQELTEVLRQTEERKTILADAQNVEEKILVLQDQMNQLLQRYPSRITLPGVLMFLQKFEEENDLKVITSVVEDITDFYDTTVPVRDTQQATEAESAECMKGKKCSIRLSYQSSYEQLKACMKYINDYPERITLDDISMAYDHTTGFITGNMTITLYAIEGSGLPYEEPDLDDISIGKDVIFETIEKEKEK